MSSFNGIRNLARSFGATAKRLACSRQGVAAVEFAFVAPVLLALYFVTLEVSHAIETNKKVGRAASMIADLITQQSCVTPTSLDAIMQIGEATLQPYDRSRLAVHVTGIQISDEGTTVAWSRMMTATGATGPDPDEKAEDPLHNRRSAAMLRHGSSGRAPLRVACPWMTKVKRIASLRLPVDDEGG